MQFEQLSGQYFRLRHELASAYAAQPWRDGHIDRLANDLASVERQLAKAGHADAHFNEMMLPFGLVGQEQ